MRRYYLTPPSLQFPPAPTSFFYLVAVNSWLELRETEVYHHLGSWTEVTEHQSQLGKEKKGKIEEVNIREQRKDQCFRACVRYEPGRA